MPGCGFGYRLSLKVIVMPPKDFGPLEVKAIRPDELARAMESALTKVTLNMQGVPRGTVITEAHVDDVGLTVSSIRHALNMPTPWVGRSGRVLHAGGSARKSARGSKKK